MAKRSIGLPLTMGIILMVLVLVLAVGWQVLVWSDLQPVSGGLSTLDWVLLVLGTLFFVVLLLGLMWLSTRLVKEVLLNQRQRAFLDAVTHEMKTPLASFRLGLDTLGRHTLNDERRAEFIERMSEDLDRLDHTVGQVLAAARAEERNRLSPRDRDSIELRGVLESCVQTLRERHGLDDDAVGLSGDLSVCVNGDHEELALIFGNLLENAVKYSEPPVEIRIDVKETDDAKVQIGIADRGIGIPPWELRKIFQRFYRAGRDVQRQVAGLGLGLYVVRSMVKRQGGRVFARSEGPGRGSRFVVTLRADRRAPVAPRLMAAEAAVRESA